MQKILYVAFMLTFSQFVNATSLAVHPNPDSIVIFVPSKDQSLSTALLPTGDKELIIEGSVAKVEKGVEPKLRKV